jgi:hypothetical protein
MTSFVKGGIPRHVRLGFVLMLSKGLLLRLRPHFMGRWPVSLMTKFIAYFDGSGSPDETIAVVVAGFVAPAEQRIEFERNWNDCLTDFSVSSLHMRDFAHSRGDFTAWKGDEDKRRRFLGRLISIIKVRVWHTFASAVIMEDYRKVDAKFCFHEFSKPFALAGGTCVAKVYRWAKRWCKVGDELAIVFEDGDKDKGDLMRAVKKHFDLTPSFLAKEKSVGFQAADLLAYEHLQANAKIRRSETGRVFEDQLRRPIMELSTIPGGRGDNDWGFHMEDDMTDSCIKDGVATRPLNSKTPAHEEPRRPKDEERVYPSVY